MSFLLCGVVTLRITPDLLFLGNYRKKFTLLFHLRGRDEKIFSIGNFGVYFNFLSVPKYY